MIGQQKPYTLPRVQNQRTDRREEVYCDSHTGEALLTPKLEPPGVAEVSNVPKQMPPCHGFSIQSKRGLHGRVFAYGFGTFIADYAYCFITYGV